MSRREFQLVEGTARKFWAIELDDKSHTVQFGRIGTAGQSQSKEFPSVAEAKASHDKLIAEKVKKGYTEVSVAGTTAVTATTPPPAAAAPRPASPRAPRGKPDPETKVTPAPQPEPEAQPAIAASEPPSTARVIELDPGDWLWATWRPRSARPRPDMKPFDLEECLERLAKVTRSSQIPNWNWSKIRFAPTMTREEAHFWLVAVSEVMRRNVQPGYFVQELRERKNSFDGRPTLQDAIRAVRIIVQNASEPLLAILATLFSPTDLIAISRENQSLKNYRMPNIQNGLLEGFRRSILPFLTDAEYRATQDEVRPLIGTPALPPNHYAVFPLEVYMAAALGLHEEVARIARSLPDDHYVGETFFDFYHRPQLITFGLGDPRSVESEMRRLKLILRKPEYIRAWIAHTEDNSLEFVRDSILTITNRDECAALVQVLGLVKSARTAGPMLELMLGSKAPGVARAWLEENPGHAIPGLIPLAAGKGRLADAALDYLRAQKRKDREGFIRECLASAPPDVAEKLRREVLEHVEDAIPVFDEKSTPDWLRVACDEARKLKPPAWVAADELRPLLVDGHRLNADQARSVLAAVARSTLDAPQPLVAALKAHAEARSLDAFAWSLFERRRAEGAPSKEKWAMGALGLLGSDGSALKLTPLIRAWPGESQHQRAVFGLECLRAIGTDVALMQLNGIAQKLSFKGLKAKATEFMERIAEDRGLSRAQLEDRIVPDCDLDERGGRIFDFGPRQFQFALGSEMKPLVSDEAGKLKDDLPKPGVKDDAARATAAVEDWKRLKKQIREVAKVQAERLEQAMVTGRRWSPADFESLLVRHPLMIHLVRLVLWGGYDEAGKLVSTFRVTEERDYADVNEASYRLEGMASVGVVHPLHLTDEQRSAWGEIFGDYEIIPPFPQLGRSVRRLEPGREKDKDLAKGEKITVPAVTLVGILERHGWTRGIPQDAGIFHEHSKPFEGAKVTAVIQYPGIPVGYMVDWQDQDVEKCFFVPGIYSPRSYAEHKNTLPLGAVDPVVISEVLGTLSALAAKGK